MVFLSTQVMFQGCKLDKYEQACSFLAIENRGENPEELHCALPHMVESFLLDAKNFIQKVGVVSAGL